MFKPLFGGFFNGKITFRVINEACLLDYREKGPGYSRYAKKDALYSLGILLINHQKFINSLLIITKPDVLCTGPRVRPYAH